MPRLREARPDAGRLSRDRIVAAAIDAADADGIEALSMRRLAQRLDVDPMSLYHWVRDKGDLLAAMADAVVAGIERPVASGDWRTDLRALILASRARMLAHPWTKSVIVERAEPTPAAIAHIDAVLRILRGGGASIALAHHALHVLGSRVLGFSQDLFDDAADADAAGDPREQAAAFRSVGLEAVAELAAAADHEGGLGGCDDDEEFAFGLDLLLDGLERARVGV